MNVRKLGPDSLWRHRLLLGTFPCALILGTWGFLVYGPESEPATFSNALYHAAQLFVLHTPHFSRPVPPPLEIARWLALVSTGLVLFETAAGLVRKERSGRRLLQISRHAVVCGTGARGMAVIESLRRDRVGVVAIDKSPDAETVQRLADFDVLLVRGDATRSDVLHAARIEDAKALYALCTEDLVNCEIAVVAARLPRHPNGRTCYIHISESGLRESLQATVRADGPLPGGGLRFIDAFDPEALDLLVHKLPLDHDGIVANDSREAHLVIIGFGRMGRALALRAAQLGHFANGSHVRISVLDRKAGLHRAALLFRYPGIDSVIDLESYDLEAASPDARTLIENWCRDPASVASVVVCFDDEALATDIALRLSPEFDCADTRAAIRVSSSRGMAAILQDVRTYSPDERFGMLATPERDPIEAFARNIHKAYVELTIRQFTERGGDPGGIRSRLELQEWDVLREDFRESSRIQAAHLLLKLRSVGLEAAPRDDLRPVADHVLLANLERLAELEHRRWVAERRIAGWQYGRPSDKARKINENLTEWDRLPDDVKAFDRDAIRRIPELLASVGLKVVLARRA